MVGISISAVNDRMGAPGKFIAQSRFSQLNQIDSAKLERGYYENLLAVDRFNGELWSLYTKRPPDWANSMIQRGLAVPTGDFRIHKFKPLVQGDMNGVPLRTNQWGMRDLDYSQQKPPGCYRIAVLGDSHVMAHMVPAELDFESLLEDRLNRQAAGAYKCYELLNFASNGYRPIAQAAVLEREVLPFQPDALFLIGHDGDASRAVLGIAIGCREGVDVTDPDLLRVFERAGVDRNTPEPVMLGKLASFGDELLQLAYKRIVKDCIDNGIRPIFVLMPTLEGGPDPANIQLARAAGFWVIDLTGCYAGHDEQQLRVAEWDRHPNAQGHRLVADRLFEQLTQNDVIPLGMSPGKSIETVDEPAAGETQSK